MTRLRAGGAHWRLILPSRADTPARARREIDERVDAGERRGDVAVLVSEVVTNAVRHGGGAGRTDVVVEVAVSGGDLCVRVLDGGDGVPRQRSPGADGGFGLHLVEALADAWGARPGEVWFRLGLAARPAAA